MSLISGSYSRACGGGGAPDCRGDIVENCLKEGVRCEAAKVALQLRARGARRARAGSRRFLEAVRTPRLIADMIVNWMKRGEFQQQRRVQASPKENLRLATLLFGLDFMAGPFVPRNMVVHTSATIGINLVTFCSGVGIKRCSESTNDKQPFVVYVLGEREKRTCSGQYVYLMRRELPD